MPRARLPRADRLEINGGEDQGKKPHVRRDGKESLEIVVDERHANLIISGRVAPSCD
jgi:hypothetical protein